MMIFHHFKLNRFGRLTSQTTDTGLVHLIYLDLQILRYLLGRDFRGQRIGQEPATDKFVAVFTGPDERVIPGNLQVLLQYRETCLTEGQKDLVSPL